MKHKTENPSKCVSKCPKCKREIDETRAVDMKTGEEQPCPRARRQALCRVSDSQSVSVS
jgi:hypothetical protein